MIPVAATLYSVGQRRYEGLGVHWRYYMGKRTHLEVWPKEQLGHHICVGQELSGKDEHKDSVDTALEALPIWKAVV
jgi:hypothetical protein